MPHGLKVLIADDEPAFLQVTAAVLRKEGYTTDCAADADEALEQLAQHAYDVLISDIRMPGNMNLELVTRVQEISPGLPVILVTGYASVETAVQSVTLPVVAYMQKPVASSELLAQVRLATRNARTRRLVDDSLARLRESTRDLESVRGLVAKSPWTEPDATVQTFLTLTQHNIANSLKDLHDLTAAVTRDHRQEDACHLLQCPRPVALMRALQDTVAVLEKTKHSFKSKELGSLREHLLAVIARHGSGVA